MKSLSIRSAVAALAIVPLVALVGAADATAAAPALKPTTTRLVGFASSPATVRVGGVLWDAVTILPQATRTVTVQVRRAGAARFANASTGRTSAQGQFLARLKPRAAGTWQFRLVIPAGSGATRLVSAARTVRASGPAATTQLRGMDRAPVTVAAGSTVTDSVTVLPRGLRTYELQTRRPSASRFTTAFAGTTSPNGSLRVAFTPTAPGAWAYRLVVRASRTALGLTSRARVVTATGVSVPPDTTPPGPVTNLSVRNGGGSSVDLSWTNPSATDFAGVIVRRAIGATAPASPTLGTAVVTTSGATTSFTDTTTSASTTYSYALFAVDTARNASTAATGTTTTGLATVAALSLHGSSTAAKETRGLTEAFSIAGTSAGTGLTLLTGKVDFGDGSVLNFSGTDPALWQQQLSDSLHAYAQTGTFTATFTVMDSTFRSASSQLAVSVFEDFADGDVTIASSPANPVAAGTDVTFEVHATLPAGTEATDWLVFNQAAGEDAVVGTGVPPVPPAAGAPKIRFAAPGTYLVTVEINNDAGGLGTATVTVVVQ